MKGWVSYYIIKPDIRLIGTDVLVFQPGFRVKIVGNLISFDVQLTAVEIRFHRQKIKEVSHTAGQIRNDI